MSTYDMVVVRPGRAQRPSIHDNLPWRKELAAILDIPHASAHGRVNQLVRKGTLKREPGMARGIVILRDPEDIVPDPAAVPIVGRVAAGRFIHGRLLPDE